MNDGTGRRRQGSLILYGLDDRAQDPAVAADVDGLLELARTCTGADVVTLVLFDGDTQVTAAATPGGRLGAAPREASAGWAAAADIRGQDPSGDVILVAGLRAEAQAGATASATGDLGALRLFAVAPLIGQEGLTLGMLCALANGPKVLGPHQLALLAALRDAVLQRLDVRRRQREHRPLSPVQGVPSTPHASVPAGEHADIARVIASRDVRAVFQPVVRLATGTVVGFEALARGPEGSDLEAPGALIAAARSAGRLGELDWVLRTSALEAALAADLHPSLSWFVNVEPSGLAQPCPEDLLGVHNQARLRLRVVLELTERDANGYVSHLLEAAAQARDVSWGVSLDDIGADGLSLALLPLLQPDVIKLDMRRIIRLPGPSIGSILATVNAYAEASGATVLAEGIEDQAQHDRALMWGVTYGQGYFYGRPGPLPQSVPVPREAIPLRQAFTPHAELTPFEIVRAQRPVFRVTMGHLARVSEHFERQGKLAVDASVLLACLMDVRHFDDRRRARYHDYSTVNAFTMAVGRDFPEQVTPRFRLAGLRDDNRLAREWSVIIVSPHSYGAVLARESGEVGPDGLPTFDMVETHDRPLVVRAARSFLHHSENPPPVAVEPAAAEAEHASSLESGGWEASRSRSRWRRSREPAPPRG